MEGFFPGDLQFSTVSRANRMLRDFTAKALPFLVTFLNGPPSPISQNPVLWSQTWQANMASWPGLGHGDATSTGLYFTIKIYHLIMFHRKIIIFFYMWKSCNVIWSAKTFNSLWPSDAIWRHKFGSTLVKVMAWYLMAIIWTNVGLSSVTFIWGQFYQRYFSHQLLKLPWNWLHS